MGEISKRITALLILLGNVSMVLNANQNSAFLSEGRLRINPSSEDRRVIDEDGRDLVNDSISIQENERNFDFENEFENLQSFDETSYLIQKSSLYMELLELKKSFEKNGFSGYSQSQLKEIWENKVNEILKTQNNANEISESMINDFYITEKEVFNSLLNEYLYDQSSLRKESDQNTASMLVERLSNDIASDINAEIEKLLDSDSINYRSVETGENNSESEKWYNELTLKINEGLEKWNEAEREFLLEKEEWELKNKLQFVEDVEIWNKAYSDFNEKKELWKKSVSEKIRLCNAEWEDKFDQLESNIQRTSDCLGEQIAVEYNQKLSVIEARYKMINQVQSLIDSTEESVSMWMEKWGNVFYELNEKWKESQESDELLSCVENERIKYESNVAAVKALDTFETWINTIEDYRELKTRYIRELKEEYSAQDANINELCSYTNELKKIEALKEYWSRQVQINKALYDYSINRSSSAEGKDVTLLNFENADKAYELAMQKYLDAVEKLEKYENEYKQAQEGLEKQKDIVNKKLEEFEALQQKINDVKYDVSVTELSVLKKNITNTVNTINLSLTSDAKTEQILNGYLSSLKNKEYNEIISNAENICLYISEKQTVKVENESVEIPGIEDLKKIISDKKNKGDDYSSEQFILDNKLASIEYINTGIIDEKKYNSVIEKDKIIENYKSVSLEVIKQRDLETLNDLKSFVNDKLYDNEKLYEKLCDYKESGVSDYIVTALDLLVNQSLKKSYSEDRAELNAELNNIYDSDIEISNLDYHIESYKKVFSFLIENIDVNEELPDSDSFDYLSNLEKEEKIYLQGLENIRNLVSEYNVINEKYTEYADKIDEIKEELVLSESEYKNELDKILPDNENSLYVNLNSIFTKYSSFLDEVKLISEELDKAELDYNIASEIKKWAENEYLHNEEGNLLIKERYDESLKKLEYATALEKNLTGLTHGGLSDYENSLIEEYEKAAENLYTFNALFNEVQNEQYVQKENILSLKEQQYSLLSRILAEYDCDVSENSFEIPDVINQFVKIEKVSDENGKSSFLISFSDEGTDQEVLKEYLTEKNIVTYSFDDSIVLNSQAFVDAQNFLRDLEEKSYSIEDLLLAVCYLKYINNKELYFEGEDPENSDFYPLGIPKEEMLGVNFAEAYQSGRINELKKSYEKIESGNGLDDIAKFLVFANYNFSSELELSKRETDVIAYRGLQSVIDNIYKRCSKYEYEAFGYTAGIAALTVIACLPLQIGAWALAPISILAVALTTCIVSSNSLKEVASDVKNVQKGYKEITAEYSNEYNDITENYIRITDKFESATEKYNLLYLENDDKEFSYDDFCSSLNQLVSSQDYLNNIQIDNKSIGELFNSSHINNKNLFTSVCSLYEKALNEYNSTKEKISLYINDRNKSHNEALAKLNKIENSCLSTNQLDADIDVSETVNLCYGENSWNQVLFLGKLNEACDNAFDAYEEGVDKTGKYYDFCFSLKEEVLDQILTFNYVNTIEENDFENNIKFSDFYSRLDDWNKQVKLASVQGEKQWVEAEEHLYDSYDQWKMKWSSSYADSLEKLNDKYESLVNQKCEWIKNQYSENYKNVTGEIAIDNDLYEIFNFNTDTNNDVVNLLEKSLSDDLENLDSLIDSLSLSDISMNMSSSREITENKLKNINVLDNVNSQINLVENEIRKSSASYAAVTAEKIIREQSSQLIETVKSENEKMTKWQEDMVRRDGYSVGDEISRYAVIDSTVLQNTVRKKQTVHKYRWFEVDIPDVTLDSSGSIYTDLDAYDSIIQKSVSEINLLYERIFGDSDGEFSKHVGYAPEFVSNVNLKKGRFENISKNGSGELGEIMLDFMWNSLENSEGYAQLGTPLYDKKITSENTFLGFELPSLRNIADIVCSIAANATGQVWFNYFDDAVFTAMDYEYNRVSLNDIISKQLKSACSSLIGSASSYFSNLAGNITSAGGQFLAKSGIKAASSYLTSVSGNFIDSVDYENGFSVDWDRVNNGWFNQDLVKSTIASFGSEFTRLSVNTSLDDHFFKDGLNKDLNGKVFDAYGISRLNETAANLTSSAFEYAVTGRTSLNLLSAAELGFKVKQDVGLFELDFEGTEVTAKLGSGGASVSAVQLLNADAISDVFRIGKAKAEAKNGNYKELAILNGINAAANAGTEISIASARAVWRKKVGLTVEASDYLGRSKDGNIYITDKFNDNTADAAAQFASVLVHEFAHVAEADEFQARIAGYETYSKLKSAYEITEDAYLNVSDVYKMTDLYETEGAEGLFQKLLFSNAFEKQSDGYDYYLLQTDDEFLNRIKQTAPENFNQGLGFAWDKEKVNEYNEKIYQEKYSSYIEDEFNKYVKNNPDSELTKEEFIEEGIASYSNYEAFREQIVKLQNKTNTSNALSRYNFELRKYISLGGYGCVLTTAAYAAYTANGTLKSLIEINELLKEKKLFSANPDEYVYLNYGENFMNAVNAIAGDEVLVGFERVSDKEKYAEFIENIQNSKDAYVCMARVNNNGHATMMSSDQKKNAINEKGEMVIGAIKVIDSWGYNNGKIGRDTYSLSEVSNITAYKVDLKHRKETMYERIIQKKEVIW